MKNLSSSLIGGIAGAVALNIIHQTVKQIDNNAPHIDLIGEEALSKGLSKAGIRPPVGDSLFAATLVADLISNAAYYSLIGAARQKRLPYVGAATGLGAGLGALLLTKPLGLDDSPITRTPKTKLLTVAWYALGGIIAGKVIQALRK